MTVAIVAIAFDAILVTTLWQQLKSPTNPSTLIGIFILSLWMPAFLTYRWRKFGQRVISGQVSDEELRERFVGSLFGTFPVQILFWVLLTLGMLAWFAICDP
jgi:hypothetical protein